MIITFTPTFVIEISFVLLRQHLDGGRSRQALEFVVFLVAELTVKEPLLRLVVVVMMMMMLMLVLLPICIFHFCIFTVVLMIVTSLKIPY